jgi:hypothetical protein
LPILGVLFVALKLCGVIDWSWWAVTLPFWVLYAPLLLVFLAGVVFAGVAKTFGALESAVERYQSRRSR